MFERLNFNVSAPRQNVLSEAQPAVRITVANRITDSIVPWPKASQGLADTLGKIWNELKSCLRKVWDWLCCKKQQTEPAVQTVSIATTTELAAWQAGMRKNLQAAIPNRLASPYLDLSGRTHEPGFCPALGMAKIPRIGHYTNGYPVLNNWLTVKFPASQLQKFPEAMKSALSNYPVDQLDLYFMVWQDIPRIAEDPRQAGKRNLIFHPIAFPDAQEGQTHYQDLSMGIFDADGIEQARGNPGQAMPWGRFGEQHVCIHPRGQAMCVSPDDARFHLPTDRPWSSFHCACKLPNNRAIAVFGIIANSQGDDDLLFALGRADMTLQQYLTGIQNSQLDPRLKGKVAQFFS